MVLRPVGCVYPVVDRSFHRLEGDFLRHAGGGDPPRLLPHRGLVPARVRPVVGAHVEGVVDHHGPDPRRRAVRNPVLAERGDVQVIALGDPAQLVLRPCGHGGSSWFSPAAQRQGPYGRSSLLTARRSAIARWPSATWSSGRVRSKTLPGFTCPFTTRSMSLGR